MTVLELFTASMHRLGYLEATEAPESADTDACLVAANAWIDALALEDMFLYRIARQVFDLQANVGSYTIGTGATFNTPRPVTIYDTGVMPSPSDATPREIPLGAPLSVQEYVRVVSKTQTSAYPGAVYYDPAFAAGYGTIHVFPVPDSATPDLVLYLPERLSEFSSLFTDLDYPPGYRRFLITNLAVEFAPILGATPSNELVRSAEESRVAVMRANVRPEELLISMDVPGMSRRGRYDIFTG
jgi:hypothetical protein